MAGAATIQNVAGKFGQTATSNARIVMWMVNGSGGSLRTGDVVITNAAGTSANTTTSASNKLAIGVVGESASSNIGSSSETFASGVQIPVVIYGPARINIAANTVAAGDNLSSSTAAKVAAKAADAANTGALQALVGSFVAVALEADSAKDSNNTIRCFVTKA